jgi:cytochrome c556
LPMPASTPRSTPRLVLAAFVATLLLALLGVGAAQAADDQVWIEYRQTVMSGIGAQMGGIGDILKNGLPLTPNIEYHALAISQSSHLIAPAFKQKVVAGATDAKPEIWSDPVKFQQAIDKMKSEADLLAAAVGEGNMDLVPGRVKALGKSCGGCHESFRKPNEESYKNK